MIFLVAFLVVFNLLAPQCHGACAEVDSLTEAVAGEGFLLGCISCKRREEVSAQSTVDWHFKPPGEEEFRHIFHYDHPSAEILHEDFSDRLEWRGTKTSDIQIGAIYILNVTFNDTGMFRCSINRTLFLPQYDENVLVEKEVELTVVAVADLSGEGHCQRKHTEERDLSRTVSQYFIRLCALLFVWLCESFTKRDKSQLPMFLQTLTCIPEIPFG
uniref:Sodium channel regulatory subunit beta-3 n=1 Tax=Gasterosteus aculeatus aculeatus TaxID=481459 RepID=A0AAQ4RP44_GASAC